MRSKARGLAWPVAFSPSVRLVGWLPAAGSGVAVAVGLLLSRVLWSPESSALTPRAVETVVPLVYGLQAAFLFSPESEPPLELLLSCPRPLAWLTWERFLALVVLQGSVAVAGTLVASVWHPEGWLLAVARWAAPSLFLGGVAFFVTQMTREGAFGALLATLMWGGMLFGGDALLSRLPHLWPLHVYLQPEGLPRTLYWLNRAALLTAGLALMGVGTYLAQDEERLLGLRTGRRGRRKRP